MRSFLPYEYRNLDDIPFIETVIIHPPFITYSKRNKRDGVFPETKHNPIEDLKLILNNGSVIQLKLEIY